MGLVFDRDEEVLASIYSALCSESSEQALAQAYGITLDRFLDTYRNSLIVGLEIGGELAGGMYFEKGTVHIGILPRFHARWARWLRPMLEIGFKQYGPRLKALVNARNVRAQQFVERVGCVRVRTRPLAVEYAVIEERMR